MSEISSRFLTLCASTLSETYLPRIREAVERLSEEEIWRRDGDVSNSIGNLLMHLSGNVRQYIVGGLGGAADLRNRPLEFAARGGISKDVLLKELEATVADAVAALRAFDPAQLETMREIQNKPQVLLDAVFHSVEHFAHHTGQILYVVKARRQQGFDWHKHLDPK